MPTTAQPKVMSAKATSNSVTILFSSPVDVDSVEEMKCCVYASRTADGQTELPVHQPNKAILSGDKRALLLAFPDGAFQHGEILTFSLQGKREDTQNWTGGAVVEGKRAREVVESVEDAVAYPLLTEQVSFPAMGGAPNNAYGSGSPGATLDSQASMAIGNALGWKLNDGDPRGFIGALTQAFTLNDVEGHTEATWNPRTYAVQTDLGGGITGAQASLYSRAQDAIQQSLQLLDGLYPLDPDADPEYVKALREMAKSQMKEILGELGTVGGPSVLRVDTYFQILLGESELVKRDRGIEFDPDKIQGTLGTLRQTYGIYFVGNPFLNSIADEQNVTNFRVISDYLTSLLQSWHSNRKFFLLGTGHQAFFGTQLVLLSRQFSVISESVNEVRFALDSVFIGAAERQTVLLEFDRNEIPGRHFPPMFIEDVLQQIQSFVTVEGPRLLQDGGKISIPNNILPVLENFRDLVRLTRRPTNLHHLPDGFRTVRVQRAYDDLHDQLRTLIQLVKPVGQFVPPPLEEAELGFAVLSITPSEGSTGTAMTIVGRDFTPGIKVHLYGKPYETIFVSENLAIAMVPSGTAAQELVLTHPDGREAKLRTPSSRASAAAR